MPRHQRWQVQGRTRRARALEVLLRPTVTRLSLLQRLLQRAQARSAPLLLLLLLLGTRRTRCIGLTVQALPPERRGRLQTHHLL
jgi:hypothetical protein